MMRWRFDHVTVCVRSALYRVLTNAWSSLHKPLQGYSAHEDENLSYKLETLGSLVIRAKGAKQGGAL